METAIDSAMTPSRKAMGRAKLSNGNKLLPLTDGRSATARRANGALEEFRKAKAAYYIEKAERLRAELLAMKGNPKNRAAKE